MTLTRVLATAVYLVFWVGVGLGWPLDKVGTGLQLLGVGIALLGVPVMPPFCSKGERKVELATQAARRRLAALRRKLRDVWARLSGRRRVNRTWVSLTPAGEVSAAGTLTFARTRVDRATLSDRAWIEHPEDQLHLIRDWIDAHEQARPGERDALDRRLDDLRADLQAHTRAATTTGWPFITWGASCSAVGTILALVS